MRNLRHYPGTVGAFLYLCFFIGFAIRHGAI